MQPVNTSRLQHQVIPAQQRISGYRETSPYPAETNGRGESFILPEDVVNLSTDRSFIADSPVNKKPSVPVTTSEKKALRDSFSVYV
ncbi:MAG: hypothetical protein WCL71_00155 [Deltaproteobacteria bacterium]